jgi:hypothetical protein
MSFKTVYIPESWKIIEIKHVMDPGKLHAERKMQSSLIHWCDRYMHVDKDGATHNGYMINYDMATYQFLPVDDEDCTEDDDEFLDFERQFTRFPYFPVRPDVPIKP